MRGYEQGVDPLTAECMTPNPGILTHLGFAQLKEILMNTDRPRATLGKVNLFVLGGAEWLLLDCRVESLVCFSES
jgi:hypothetical protein